MLEEIVEAKLLEEPLTLAFLQELNIFNFGSQIQEVRETLRQSTLLNSIFGHHRRIPNFHNMLSWYAAH